MSDKPNCEKESLRTQLSELNIRARAYTSQLWQVPFAYIGILSLGAVQIADKGAVTAALVFLYGALFGTAVVIHMMAMLEGNKRAVRNIRHVESKLGLKVTAKHRPLLHIGPLIVVVALAAISSFVAAGYYLYRVVNQ